MRRTASIISRDYEMWVSRANVSHIDLVTAAEDVKVGMRSDLILVDHSLSKKLA